jgi:hypothetical protein
LVYSQIWLNLPTDDCHFFYVFLWMIATLAMNKNSLEKTLDCFVNVANYGVVSSCYACTHKHSHQDNAWDDTIPCQRSSRCFRTQMANKRKRFDFGWPKDLFPSDRLVPSEFHLPALRINIIVTATHTPKMRRFLAQVL